MSKQSSLEAFFQDWLRLNPSMAAFFGDHSHDHEYNNTLSRSYSIKFSKLLHKYKRTPMYGPEIEKKMLSWVIKDSLEFLTHPTDLLPIDSHSNTIVDFTFVNTQMYPLKTEQDVHNILSRHQAFQEIIYDMEHKMRIGMKRGVVLPKMICNRVIESIEKFVRTKGYMIELPRNLQTLDIAVKFKSFLQTSYRRSIHAFLKFIKDEYLHACRDTIGLRYIPGGLSWYKYEVRSLTTVDTLTPEYAHRLGLKEVARLMGEFDKVKKQLKYPDTMSVETFVKHMLDAPENYYKNKQEVLADFRRVKAYIDKHVIPKNFAMNVRDHDLKQVPHSMEKTSPGAFYYPPSTLNNSRPGVFYLNLRDVKECPKYSTMTLSLHEGKPGHHYQFQYMVDTKVPIHKMYSVNSTSFVEGWGLYAESLGNYSKNPYDYFGKLTYEMFRAVRLVVDTGIHYYGWSFEQAVDYMAKHLAMSRSEIETEVERYICMPAQALCYKIGELELQKMRTKWIARYGETEKSIQAFHTCVLEDGVLPLDILKKKINIWIHK